MTAVTYPYDPLFREHDLRPQTLLLIEDNPGHARLISRCIERIRNDLRIIHCSDGESALAFLEGCVAGVENLPDVILLDLRLPKVDGLEVLKRIKASAYFRSVPVVVLTTSSSPNDRREAYENRVNSYLLKPVKFDDFNRLADSLCSYWLTWNRC